MKLTYSLGLIVFLFSLTVGVSYLSAKSYTGKITIDGSSTVFPVSEAVAEEAMKSSKELRKLRVAVSFSGTGGGFKKFCKGEIEITGASRPIKDKEVKACASTGVEFIELPVAYDGVAVITHPSNSCVSDMTTAELKKVWEPAAQGKITNWNQIRSNCPNLPLALFGPGADSGTFDYFTEEIVGESKLQRSDYEAAEDDNVLVRGIAQNKGSLGYLGYAYYEQNAKRIKLLGVDSGTGAIKPSPKTIGDGSYQPLARPLFIYVSKQAAERPEVAAFVKFYLDNAAKLATEVGYAPLGANDVENGSLYNTLTQIFEKRKTGTAFQSIPEGMTVPSLIKSRL